MHNIEPIYVIYAIFLAVLGLIKNKKIQFWSVFFSFVIIFVMAEIGPDYAGYRYLYNSNAKGVFEHGELLYSYINKFCANIGISYNLFRIIFLSICLFIFLYSLNKMTSNISVCFMLYYLVFIVYLISAYRQFAIISIFVFSIYILYYKESKNNIFWNMFVLAINFMAVFIHTAAILQLGIILICILFKIFKLGKLKNLAEKILVNSPLVLLICLAIRLMLYGALSIPFFRDILLKFPYFIQRYSAFDFGQIARLVILLNLYEMNKKVFVSQQTKKLYNIYGFSMLLYFVLPFDLMGRLINTIRVFESILFLSMIGKYKNFEYCKFRKFKISKQTIHTLVMVGTCILIFVSQMAFQNGYQYVHMFIK